MNPKAIPAALRDFAAAAATSPDAAKSVSDLALLIAELFDQARAFVEAEADTRSTATIDHDELAFPPVDDLKLSTNGGEFVQAVGHNLTEANLSELAREAAGLTPEAWAAMPAEEQTVHRRVAELKVIADNTAAA